MSDLEDYEEYLDPDVVPTNETRGRKPLIYQEINLESYEDARALYQRITRDYGCGKLTRERARNLGYLLSGLLAFHRMDLDQELLRRVERIEARLDEQRVRR